MKKFPFWFWKNWKIWAMAELDVWKMGPSLDLEKNGKGKFFWKKNRRPWWRASRDPIDLKMEKIVSLSTTACRQENQKIVKTTLSTWQNRLLQIGLPKTIDLGRLGLRPGFARRTKSTSLDFFEIKFFFRRRPKKSLRIDFCFFKHGSALSRCPPVAEKKTK